MKNIYQGISSVLILFFLNGCGGGGVSPVQDVPVVIVVPVVVAPVALFAATPQLLPDLRAKYDALCGNQVSVQNAIPANLTGHTDGKKDLVFSLTCGQVAGTVTTAPTVNGVVALIQQADGSFVDGTRTLFGVDMVDLIGNGGQSVVYDFNGDGKDDIVFSVTGEDGRALPQGFTGNNRQNVFLTSKQNGTYSVERLGPYSYNAYISLVDNEFGGKDVSISTIGYGGTNTTWRYQNGWNQLGGNNSISAMAVYFKRTASNLASTTAISQANAGISLFTRTNGSAWSKTSNWSFPNPKSVPWQGWNGDLGTASMVTYNDKDYVSVVFENGCELKLKPTDTSTVAIMALNTLEIVGGYQGGTIVESSSYLKPITKIMAFTTSNNVLTNINLTVKNEVQNVQFFQISCSDLNGDGSDDILVMPWGTNAVPIIYLNDGAGNFSLVDTSKLPVPSTYFRDATMIYVDITGDGIRDLLYWPLTSLSGNPSKVQYQIFKGLRAANATDIK
jgi:FG-GAP-like repeat